MGRIFAIDYGTKRTGIAVTDPLKIIANGLDTVPSNELLKFLINYLAKENVELFLVGLPKQMNNQPSESAEAVLKFVEKLKKQFPAIPISLEDERFTSKMAFQTMIDSGLNKKDRQNKALIDKISATIILQSYLESVNRK